jgi:hypothetical protein
MRSEASKSTILLQDIHEIRGIAPQTGAKTAVFDTTLNA